MPDTLHLKNLFIPTEELEKLLTEYKIPLQIKIYDKEDEEPISKRLAESIWLQLKDIPHSSLYVQLAELLLSMETNKFGNLQISYNIPKTNELKGGKKIVIGDGEFIDGFKHFLYTRINQYGDGIEEGDVKALRAFVKNEKKTISMQLVGNSRVGSTLQRVYSMMNEYYIFEGWTQTKIYSFLYDWGVLAGFFYENEKGYSGEVGSEKFNVVRNRIMAFENKSTSGKS